jgi:tetratricopeptide (TPR) repeat protein
LRKLNVATVLEGSVRKSGKRVRITAQLIEVASIRTSGRRPTTASSTTFSPCRTISRSRWSRSCDRTDGNRSIGDRHAVAADVRLATNGRSDNPEAFQLYLQGKFYGERTTQADTDKAIDLYNRAIAIDPKFALAWAGMAHMHQVQAGFGFAAIDDGFERARDAAQHALRLAPNAPEGHVELGRCRSSRQRPSADASYRRALELAPGDAKAVLAAASLGEILRRFDIGLGAVRKAIARSSFVPIVRPLIYLSADRVDDAAAEFQLALISIPPRASPTPSGDHAAPAGPRRGRMRLAQAESTTSSATWRSR